MIKLSNDFFLRYAYVTLKDPLIPITLLLKGEKGLSFLFLKRLLNLNPQVVKMYLKDLQSDFNFSKHINETLKRIGRYVGQFTAPELLYIIIRAIKPRIVVETGVAMGISSAYILKGLEDNNYGTLYSIDLPNYEIELAKKGLMKSAVSVIPEGFEVGCAVPENLRHRWKLHIGNTREVLPKLLKELGEVDVFFHDSEHTYENMIFEFETAWKHLKLGGLLLSDDVFWNKAFFDFAKRTNRKAIVHYYNTQIGAIKK